MAKEMANLVLHIFTPKKFGATHRKFSQIWQMQIPSIYMEFIFEIEREKEI